MSSNKFRCRRHDRFTAEPLCPMCGTSDHIESVSEQAQARAAAQRPKYRAFGYRVIRPNAYSVKAVPTYYSGVMFSSRLEATWAAFFDLAGWTWDYEPTDFLHWKPYSLVTFTDYIGQVRKPCVEVKPRADVAEFETRFLNEHGVFEHTRVKGPRPESLALGQTPHVARLLRADGGTVDDVNVFLGGQVFTPEDVLSMWKRAKNTIKKRAEDYES